VLKCLTFVVFAILAVLTGATGAQAQVNVTYLDFEGRAFVTTNPTSGTCQAQQISFGSVDTVVYRFTLNPASVRESLSFTGSRESKRIESTVAPGYSLNGLKNVRWDGIDTRAGLTTDLLTTSDLTIKPIAGTGITKTTTGVTITGTVNDYLFVTGCTVTITAALVRRPD